MNFKIFKFELKSYTRSVVTWSLSLSALSFLYMSFFATFSENTAAIDKAFEKFPKELLDAFGVSTDLPLSSLAGFFAFIFVFMQICIAIQSANYGFTFMSIEERELTADFLYTRPVSRNSILFSKYSALLIAMIITDLFVLVSSLLALSAFAADKNPDYALVSRLILWTFIFRLFFIAAGFLITELTAKIRSVLTYSMGVAFGTYMISAVSGITSDEKLAWFSPFKHFEPSAILKNGAPEFELAGVSIAFIVVANIVAYALFKKRNIHSL